MHAFDYISILLSFVAAAATIHVLATIAEVILARRRLRMSWLNAGWMLASLLTVVSWWIGGWDLRNTTEWPIALVMMFFGMISVVYLQVRLVCPPIAADGFVDLQAFHRDEGRAYMGLYAAVAAANVTNNALGPGAQVWARQNYAYVPMLLAAVAAAVFPRRTAIQVGALAVQLAAWVVYFAALQPQLSG